MMQLLGSLPSSKWHWGRFIDALICVQLRLKSYCPARRGSSSMPCMVWDTRGEPSAWTSLMC